MTRSDLAHIDRVFLSRRLFDLPGLLNGVGCIVGRLYVRLSEK
jgi:hypothetical protein